MCYYDHRSNDGLCSKLGVPTSGGTLLTGREMLADLIKLIDRGYDAKSPQMWPVYGTGEQLDRREVITASEVGYCARKLKFDKLAMIAGGYDPAFGTKNHSKQDWGFFERGHTMEAWAVDLIHAGLNGYEDTAGINLFYTGKGQVSFKDGYQSGTPDGVYMIEQDEAVGILEIKSIDPRTNTRRLPKLVHLDQVMQNLDLVSSAFDLDPIGGDIIYINASDYKKRYQFHIPWDYRHAQRLEDRAKWIMEAESPADLPAEGLYQGHCDYCAHTAQCSAIINSEKRGMRNDDFGKAESGFFG